MFGESFPAIEVAGNAHDEARNVLPANGHLPLARMLTAETTSVRPNQLLSKIEKASMYHFPEVRASFLDIGLVEYALSLPTNQKISAQVRKWSLKRAFSAVLPDHILERDKEGFDTPIGEWLNGPLADEFCSLIPSVVDPYLDSETTMSPFEDH